MAIVVMALLTRMAIPAGYMPMVEDGHFTMTLCPEQNPSMDDTSAMAGMHEDMGHSRDHGMPKHDKNGSCGFGGLSLTSLAAADPALLALALLFIIARVFRRPAFPPTAAARFLWPPITGPPSLL